MNESKDEIFELLGVDPGELTLSKVNITNWGTEAVTECAYQGRPFQLFFEGVKSIQWDAYAESDEQETLLRVMGLLLGADAHRASALIYTELFELSILYSQMTLVKNW
ncbi:MAG: hypothetical protein IAE83_15580 [Anaerolinea sp.]|nr:hypothetical protein [Anaerolinea sp.]MCC6972606.1 hypothetical protein [Anaerolineae bacterium]CAG0981605.1 hypothetical protein ANRL4_01909 [Anaerolineae bacterium]